MVTMNNSLVKLLYFQQPTKNAMIHTLQAIQQSQRTAANNTMVDNIPAFNGKPEFYFDQNPTVKIWQQ